MADFPLNYTVGQPIIGLQDQLGAASNRAFITKGTTPFWDPPANPIPLARAPAGQEAIDDGSRGSRPHLLTLGDASQSLANPTFGVNGANQGYTVARSNLAGQAGNSARQPATGLDYDGRIEAEDPGGLGVALTQEWFEKCHVIPGALALGNILTTQIRTVELFNSFRRPREPVSWTAFVNNAGAGVTVTNLPGLPFVIQSFDSFVANVQVSTAGPPAISGTLDFTFSAPTADTFQVAVTGNRITIFQFRPQAPIVEELLFKTDVIAHQGGTEQRIKLREAPRSRYKFTVLVDDDNSRDRINAVLFDWQGRVFGVPVWHEAKPLGAPMAINDTLVVVDTADADYRTDSLVMIYDDNENQEVLEIDSFTASDITLKTGVSQAFDAVNTQVMPVRTAYTTPQLQNARYAVGPSAYQMVFETLDNVDLADIGPFDTFQGSGQSVAKPVLNQFNFMGGQTIGEGNRRRVIRLDPETGPPIQFSPWAKGKPLFQFGYEAKSQAEVYDWRQLAHYLGGGQLAFYVPTGRTDFKLLVALGPASTSLDFPNYGFTDFINSVTPRADMRILMKDGSESFHEITGSSVVSSTVERITFTPGTAFAVALEDLDRIEILSLSRIIDDKVRLTHKRPGETRVDFKTIGIPA